jgi:hypothetical protein
MSIINITDSEVIQGTDPYLTREKTATADVDGDIYTFPIYQNYIKLTNTGSYDLQVNVGRYDNKTIHPGDTFEVFTDFTQFDIKSIGGDCTFTVIAKELKTTPIDSVEKLWVYMAERDKAGDGDIVIDASDATTSAATIASAITGATGKAEVEHTFTLKDTATPTSNTHEFYYGNMPVAISGKTSDEGEVELAADYITFKAGVGKIKAILTGTWAQGEEYKVKVTGTPIMGFTVADKEISDTLA